MAKVTISNITINKTLPGVDILEIRISFAQMLAFLDVQATTPLSLIDGHYSGITSLVSVYNALTESEKLAAKKFIKMCVVNCFNNAMGTNYTWDHVPDTLFN